jgi:ribosomal protein L37AE/L43A
MFDSAISEVRRTAKLLDWDDADEMFCSGQTPELVNRKAKKLMDCSDCKLKARQGTES